jgi:hypothetical protein
MLNPIDPRRATVPAGLLAALLLPASLFCGAASAQEAPLSWAATQPAKGRVTVREQFFYTEYDTDAGGVDRFVLNTRVTLGLSGALSASADIPVVSERADAPGAEDDAGLGDISLSLKWRFWQHDTGAIETKRLALIGGVRAPTGDTGLSSGGVDPFVGAVFTMVHGRHGVNAAGRYLVSTDGRSDPVVAGMGDADLLSLEASYLYRLSPASYAMESAGSLYAVVESFVDYETNGDAEWRVAPGLLWEARRWAAEASVILPLAEDIEHRGKADFGLALGLRVLF